MSQFPGTGEFEVIVLCMKVTTVNAYYYAPKPQYNFSNLKSELRIEDKIRACEAKSSMYTKWPLHTNKGNRNMIFECK